MNTLWMVRKKRENLMTPNAVSLRQWAPKVTTSNEKIHTYFNDKTFTTVELSTVASRQCERLKILGNTQNETDTCTGFLCTSKKITVMPIILLIVSALPYNNCVQGVDVIKTIIPLIRSVYRYCASKQKQCL